MKTWHLVTLPIQRMRIHFITLAPLNCFLCEFPWLVWVYFSILQNSWWLFVQGFCCQSWSIRWCFFHRHRDRQAYFTFLLDSICFLIFQYPWCSFLHWDFRYGLGYDLNWNFETFGLSSVDCLMYLSTLIVNWLNRFDFQNCLMAKPGHSLNWQPIHNWPRILADDSQPSEMAISELIERVHYCHLLWHLCYSPVLCSRFHSEEYLSIVLQAYLSSTH